MMEATTEVSALPGHGDVNAAIRPGIRHSRLVQRPNRATTVFSVLVLVACGGTPADDPEPPPAPVTLNAMTDFERIEIDGYAPYYVDDAQQSLAINSVEYPDTFAAAETRWEGESGVFDVTIHTRPEFDGQSSYRLYVNDDLIAEHTNPETEVEIDQGSHTWNGVRLEQGDTILLTSNSVSSGLIPEGDGFAYARGRWQRLVLQRTGSF